MLDNNNSKNFRGLDLSLDPDVVAAMDDDFDYEDPENELDDDFILKAMGEGEDNDDDDEGEEGSDQDWESDSDRMGGRSEDEDEDEVRKCLIYSSWGFSFGNIKGVEVLVCIMQAILLTTIDGFWG